MKRALISPFLLLLLTNMTEFIVQAQIEVNAPKKTVWTALTNPDLTEKYFYGCRVYSNFNAGDRISFKRKILWLFPFELSGIIQKVDRGNLLKYSLKNSAKNLKSASESVVSIELHDDAGKTLVYVTDDVGQGDGGEDRYNRSVKGWDKILKGLKRISEEQRSI